jgi:hypothetical protein
MRTGRARRMVRRAVLIARIKGHKPRLISHSGALKLYGCLNEGCSTTLEGWDNPEHVSGAMAYSFCPASRWHKIREFITQLI